MARRYLETIHEIRDTISLLMNTLKMYKLTNIQRTVNFRNDSHFSDVIVATNILNIVFSASKCIV